MPIVKNGKVIRESRLAIGQRKQDMRYEAGTYTPENIFVQESRPNFRESEFYSYKPEVMKAIREYFDLSDANSRRTLMAMDEAGQNTMLTTLTSKLYDHIVKKTADIDFGDIPKTKGDVKKLPQYEDLKDVMAIMKDILKEYKEPTGPIDTLTTALANIETRKDLFNRAFATNSELPILMYNTTVLSIITGVSYMIAASIEFIKAPRDESFQIALDKMAYTKTKDHILYDSLNKFNTSCAKGDFDKAMHTVIDQRVRKFTGAVVGTLVGVGIGIVVILNIIPLLREMVYVIYHTRMKIADYFELQADLLQMNAYNLEHNNTIDAERKREIIEKQMGISEKFRKVSNIAMIDAKKTDVEANKELQSTNKKYKVDELEEEIEDVDDDSSISLF